MAAAPPGIFRRVAEAGRDAIGFVLDGRALTALRGDTVLVAVLTQADRLRSSEFDAAPRAGFCLIGACQDCWMQAEDGRRIRACTTLLEDGMRLCTRPAPGRS
jgi:predicted molibdopterin-dependent oxidoreductase YjgC